MSSGPFQFGPHFWRPAIEPLEDRRLLSAVVINTLDSGAGSLRQAILDTNATPGIDNITFNISGAGSHTITLLSSLPTITGQVVLNGASQPGFAGTPLIELNGGGTVSTGLRIEAGGSTVRGLSIGNFATGLELAVAGGNQVVGNYIGVDADGVTLRPNSQRGIAVTSDGNSIGGIVAQDRNVISGNTDSAIFIAAADNIQIRGNYIGVLPNGLTVAANLRGVHVVGDSSNITIGGTTAAARNIISGNNEGVYIDSPGTNNLIQGNYFGVGADGTTKVANYDSVVVYTGGANVTIGGTTPGARNVIVNSTAGIWVFSAVSTKVEGNYIGVLPDGVTAAANQMGIQVDGTASNTTIGGTTAAARNIISGNGTGLRAFSSGTNNVILGNYVGLAANGVTVVPNIDGIYVQDGSFTIGGLAAGARNVIVGNTANGVWLSSTNNVQVQGNYIGVLPDGVTAAGNPNNGVAMDAGAENTTIGGTTSAARNIISGNGAGIATFGLGLNNVVQGNYIGVGANGVTTVPNLDGIHVQGDGLTIGGLVAGARNVISGNTFSGVLLNSAIGAQVQGNLIGLLPDGVTATGNFTGVLLQGTASNNTIGGSNAAARNVISANVHGVVVENTGLNNSIRGNSIYANAQLGIDLGFDGPTSNDAGDVDNGPHGLQNSPVITSVSHGAETNVIGTIASTANTTLQIDFYANASAGLSGLAEGERYLGSVTVLTDGAGNASFDVNGLGASQASEFITATATGPEGTSEFSTGVDPPSIDLNGSAAGGIDRSVTWSNAGAVSLADATTALVTDAGNITLITVTIPVSQPGELLAAMASDGITVSYNAAGQVLNLTGNATAAAYQAVLRTLKYNNALGGPSASSFQVNLVAYDGVTSGNTAVATVVVQVPPRVDLNGPQVSGGNNYTSTWSNLGAVNIADSIVGVVFNGQAPNLVSMNATLVSPAAGDVLSGTAAGGIVVSYDGANGVLKMTGNATATSYQTVLRSIKYNNSSGPVNLVSKTVNVVGFDATSSSATAVATVTIQPLRLDLNGDLTLGSGYNTFWSNAGAVNITGSTGIPATTLVDGKAANLTSATATIVGVHTGDLLSATAAGGITVSYDAGNHVLNMTGSNTLANYQSVLRSVKYNNTSGGPGVGLITVNFSAVDTNAAVSNATSTTQIVLAGSQVVGRYTFYNQSGTSPTIRYDGTTAGISTLDDGAIAFDKVAYIPSATAVPSTFANVISYSRGINGIMIDLAGSHGTIESTDFIFRVGNNNTPGSAGSSWSLAPNPASISVRAGAGVGGSDRIEIIWNNGDITKKWLQVVMKTDAGTGTGLAALGGTYAANYGDVFYFGHALADSGQGDSTTLATVDGTDELEARNHAQTVIAFSQINVRDYNRDGAIDSTDALLARNNATTGLVGLNPATRFINLVAGSPPNAPEGDEQARGERLEAGGGSDEEIGTLSAAITMGAGSGSAGSSAGSSSSVTSWLSESLTASSAPSNGAATAALLQLLSEDESSASAAADEEIASLLADLAGD